MNGKRERLLQCFSSLFPQLSTAQLEAATLDTVVNWDSVASVTLVSMIEEEFGVSVDLDEYSRFTSFEACLRYLESQ